VDWLSPKPGDVNRDQRRRFDNQKKKKNQKGGLTSGPAGKKSTTPNSGFISSRGGFHGGTVTDNEEKGSHSAWVDLTQMRASVLLLWRVHGLYGRVAERVRRGKKKRGIGGLKSLK